MKFHLSAITALLGLTLALVVPAFATAGETIDCSITSDLCPPPPDLCKCIDAPALGISGDGSNADVGSVFTASGGRPSYGVEITGGVTLDYSDSGVTVASIPACAETATLTMYDACEQEATKEVVFTPPLTVYGPDIYAVEAQYTATGGHEPYTWETSCGTIGITSGIVTNADGCSGATVTVRDSCNKTATNMVFFISTNRGPWVDNPPPTFLLTLQANPDYYKNDNNKPDLLTFAEFLNGNMRFTAQPDTDVNFHMLEDWPLPVGDFEYVTSVVVPESGFVRVVVESMDQNIQPGSPGNNYNNIFVAVTPTDIRIGGYPYIGLIWEYENLGQYNDIPCSPGDVVTVKISQVGVIQSAGVKINGGPWQYSTFTPPYEGATEVSTESIETWTINVPSAGWYCAADNLVVNSKFVQYYVKNASTIFYPISRPFSRAVGVQYSNYPVPRR